MCAVLNEIEGACILKFRVSLTSDEHPNYGMINDRKAFLLEGVLKIVNIGARTNCNAVVTSAT